MVVLEHVLVPIDKIVADRDMQARERLDSATVDAYAALLEDGTEMPPVMLFTPDGADPDPEQFWLADGFHRVAAHKKIGRAHIPATVMEGQRRDAVRYAMGANASHGLQRTHEDKRRAVRLVLEDFEWRGLSDREIARMTGCTHPFVAKIREAMYPTKAAQVEERDFSEIVAGLGDRLRELLLSAYTNQGSHAWLDKDTGKTMAKAGLMYKLENSYPLTALGRGTAEYMISKDRFLTFAAAVKAAARSEGADYWYNLKVDDFENSLRRHLKWSMTDWQSGRWMLALPDWFEVHTRRGRWSDNKYARLTPLALAWWGVEAPDEPDFETWWAEKLAREAEEERVRNERNAQRDAEWQAQRQAREAAQAAQPEAVDDPDDEEIAHGYDNPEAVINDILIDMMSASAIVGSMLDERGETMAELAELFRKVLIERATISAAVTDMEVIEPIPGKLIKPFNTDETQDSVALTVRVQADEYKRLLYHGLKIGEMGHLKVHMVVLEREGLGA